MSTYDDLAAGRRYNKERQAYLDSLTDEQRAALERQTQEGIRLMYAAVDAQRGVKRPDEKAKATKPKDKGPPPGASPAARLAWANEHQTPKKHEETKIGVDELRTALGMSPAEFAALSPQRKLALVNELIEKRRGGG